MINSGLRMISLVVLMSPGCVSGGNDEDNGVIDSVGGTDRDIDTDGACDTGDSDGSIHVTVTDSQNMFFRSELTIAVATLKARSDFTIDWSELSVDMLRQDIDPRTGIDRLQMVVWQLPEADLLVKLNNDDLAMAEVEAPGMVPTHNERTSVSYLEMETVADAPIDEEMLLDFIDPDQYDPALYSYTVMVAAGTNPRLGFKMLHLLRFDPYEDNTEVRITNASTTLDYEVDIASSDTIPLPAGNPDVVVDWTDTLKKNSLGNPFMPFKIWYVNVAHYPDMDVYDLEDNFLDIEHIAEDFYTAVIESGASINLNTLVDEGGEGFGGITQEGTWIIALICGDCANPAPWFLSVLRPCVSGGSEHML